MNDTVPTLGAPGGQIHLASVAAAGEVPANLQEFTGETVARLGSVALSQGALLKASGDGGGTVRIRSGRLLLEQAAIFADNQGKVDGTNLGVDVGITEEVMLTNGAVIKTDSRGAGRAPDLRLTAGSVSLENDAAIRSQSFASGDGGNVLVQAKTVTLKGGSISTATDVQSGGNAGSIVVQVGSLALTDGAQIDSSTFGSGQGGMVTVVAQDRITITGSSSQDTQTGLFSNASAGTGRAGTLFVAAPHLELAGGRIQTRSAAASQGDAGALQIEVGTLQLTDGAQIDSSTLGSGQGGMVTVTAREALTLTGRGSLASNAASQGDAGTVTVATPTLQMEGPVTIEARTTGDGAAGNVDVKVERLTLMGGARIGSTSGLVDPTGTVLVGHGPGGSVTTTATASLLITGHDSRGTPSGVFSQTFGPGDAGSVTVTTPHLTLADGGRIGAETGGTGRGGNVVVRAGSLAVTSGAQITSSSGITTGAAVFVGSGAGGTVTVTATDPVTLSGPGSGLSTSTIGAGPGGSITLHAPRLGLSETATISAESTGSGNAGSVTITTLESFLLTNGSVVTRAAQADGGNIQITAPTVVRLRESAITAEVGGGPQTVGGNVTIDPQFVLLQNSQIVANAFQGRGGTIRIQAQQAFLADPNSTVSASSLGGPELQGTVDIRAPVVSISGAVAPLPQALAQPPELLGSRCAERLRVGVVSRLVVGGRDGVPLEPGSLLLSPLQRVNQEGGGDMGERERPLPEAQHGRAWYVQAQAPEGLAVECAQWRGPSRPTGGPKRIR
jgi:large exoprotein involved in heme utilization and adhesion